MLPDNSKWMPLMRTGLAVRFDVLHESQALRNHSQTLDRLAERGGLSVCEALAIAKQKEWQRGDAKDMIVLLNEIAMKSEIDRLKRENGEYEAEVGALKAKLESVAQRIEQLNREVEYLRHYSNRDILAQVEDAMEQGSLDT